LGLHVGPERSVKDLSLRWRVPLLLMPLLLLVLPPQ